MKKKIKIISMILGVVMITGITSVTVLRLNSISQIEQEHIDEYEEIAEYGDIAEMYYNAFDFPDKMHKNNKLLRENGFKISGVGLTTPKRSRYVKYSKNVIINDENCIFAITFDYAIIKFDNNRDNIQFQLNCSYNETDIIIYKSYDEYSYTLSAFISEFIDDVYHSVIIDLLNGELYVPPVDDSLYLYDNYLNGEYDAVIEEMLAIMDDVY